MRIKITFISHNELASFLAKAHEIKSADKIIAKKTLAIMDENSDYYNLAMLFRIKKMEIARSK